MVDFGSWVMTVTLYTFVGSARLAWGGRPPHLLRIPRERGREMSAMLSGLVVLVLVTVGVPLGAFYSTGWASAPLDPRYKMIGSPGSQCDPNWIPDDKWGGLFG